MMRLAKQRVTGLRQGVRGADGTSLRVGVLFGFHFLFFQKINRKLPGIVLPPPGRTASQNQLVPAFSQTSVAVKLIGIKCLTPSCLSRVVIAWFCQYLLF